ncbi:MAG: aldehyde dehydrogenase family protein [Alphaproteobacteria bacterium]|nr:MAG: aldehyde dehydrogenase family protein [Alphaproteobacteria bacterium]
MPSIVCISPVDGREVVRRAASSTAEIGSAIAAARKAQAEWRRVPVAERGRILSKAVDAMLAMRDAIAPELAWQMGRPVRYGGNELNGFEERARHMIAIAESALANIVPEPKAGFRRYVAREPIGIVLTVAPWNYPYLTAVNSVVPALMAGNAVILKHAAQTLLVGDRFQAAMDKAGLPKGLFRTLTLTHDDTTELIGSGAVDQVCFTGSVGAGKAIERAAAGTFAGVGLELGGKDPAYVRPDVDLAHAVENIVDGAYFNSGQCCCGIERVYVHAGVYDTFVDRFVDLTKQYVLDDPLDPDTTLGPMAQPRLAATVREHIGEALHKGAKALIDTKPFARDRAGSTYVAPQALVDVDHSMKVMMDETFGPVVGIMKVKDDAEAVRLMNDSPYGLTASIWTRDMDAAERIGGEIETGTVYMNRCDYLDPGLAWTGVKDTGRGATLSRVGYESLTRPKSYHLREV